MKLLFVYNADSGVFNTVSDIAHKILSPQTYNCHLCALTHGYFSAKKTWLAFIEELDLSMEFLHRDEFVRAYPDIKTQLPAVFMLQDDEPSLWLDRPSIDSLQSVEELQRLIKEKLQSQGLS